MEFRDVLERVAGIHTTLIRWPSIGMPTLAHACSGRPSIRRPAFMKTRVAGRESLREDRGVKVTGVPDFTAAPHYIC